MDAFMCYGPVVPDGYGVCYNPHPDNILVAITSFNSCGETRSDTFAYTLEGVFREMKELCDAVKGSSDPTINGVMNNNEAKQSGSSSQNCSQVNTSSK